MAERTERLFKENVTQPLPFKPLRVAVAVLALPGWSLSLPQQLPSEAAALTITSCPRPSGKHDEPLATLAMIHISVARTEPWWHSPMSSGHGATVQWPCWTWQEVLGTRWGSPCRASLGSPRWHWCHVSPCRASLGSLRWQWCHVRPCRASLGSLRWHWCHVSPGRAGRQQTLSHHGQLGRLSLAWQTAVVPAELAGPEALEQLLVLGFDFGLSGCCQAGDERGSDRSSAEGEGWGALGSPSLAGRTFGEGKGLLPGHAGAGAERVTPAGALPGHPVPPSRALLTLPPLVPAVVHAVGAEDGALQNGAHPLSSSEVDELLHKADEATLSEATGRQTPAKAGKGGGSAPGSQKPTPRREITGLQAKVPPGEGTEASQEQPVTMIFMGYQNVEDENETKKVLGLEGTIKAELVVIEDAESKAEPAHKDHTPPNGTALEPAAAQPLGEEAAGGQKPGANASDAKEAEQEADAKKQRCKCCTVM